MSHREPLRVGAGEPLVLFHGVLGSADMWRSVLPLLSPHHEVIAPTALGHRGGNPALVRPARVAHVIDDAERCLDELRIERAHLAGNSLGGWVALELARRGRALSVCALSPAGAWTERVGPRSLNMLRSSVRDARLFRWILPWLAYSEGIRAFALRFNSVRPRVSRSDFLSLTDDVLGCDVGQELLESDERLEPIPAACPITLAWSQHDRVLPLRVHGERARELVPQARFVVLEGVGHVPMFDDPRLVADTILETTGRAAVARAPDESAQASLPG